MFGDRNGLSFGWNADHRYLTRDRTGGVNMHRGHAPDNGKYGMR